MTQNPLIWIGLAGIGPDDNARARLWQQRLHGVMIGFALLALPAYLLDSAGLHPSLHSIAWLLDVLIFAAFLLETVWMLHVTSFRGRYVTQNWLNFVILAGAAASALGAATEWVALIRTLRVAVGSLVLLRALSELRVLFTRRGAPLLVGATCLVMLGGAGVMYWLEPTIDSYWDALWLTFVTGTTIGYGDFVPTVPASRVFAVFIAVSGVALMTLFTANLVALFLGHGDAPGVNDESLAALAERLGGDSAARLAQIETELRALRADIAALRAELLQTRKIAPAASNSEAWKRPRMPDVPRG